MNPHTPPPGEGQDPPEAPSGLPHPASPGAPDGPPPYPSDSQAGTRTQPPPFAGAVPAQPAVPPQNFFDWVRSQGIQRDRERWVGGVASGIARRLGVDPLIVRGVLIVLTVFAGIGVLLYGLAWALLPEPDGRIHLQEAGAGRWTAGMTGALAAIVIGFPGLGSGTWDWNGHGFGAFLWTVFWLGGIGYLVYYLVRRNKVRNGTVPAAAFAGAPPAQDGAAGAAVPAPPLRYGSYSPDPGSYGSSPGSYSSGPGGYSGPVPAPAPAPARPRNPGPGTPAAAVTIGLALLAGGAVKALDAASVIDLGHAGNAVAWAAGAAVLGLGILAGGLRGRTSGVLGFLAVVALLMGAFFNTLPDAGKFQAHNADWTPSSMEQARNGFHIMGGTGTVDLTRLALNPPLAADVAVPIDAMASNVRVVIPDTVPVRLEADMMMGNLNGAGGNHSGMTSQQIDYNAGQPGARLVLQVSGAMSNVTIQEGN